MKAKRLVFAEQHEDWDEASWSKILFSDESTIQQFAQRKWTVCRLVGTRFNMTAIHKLCKTFSQCHDLGAMSSNIKAGLFFLPIETTMKGVRYRKIFP